jgi:hypothetical protein
MKLNKDSRVVVAVEVIGCSETLPNYALSLTESP